MIAAAWDSVADYGPMFIPTITIVAAGVHVWRKRRTAAVHEKYEIVLSWLFGGVVGVGGLVVTASHLFFAQAIARQIGFPAGNPFQFEVGMANFAFAVLGIGCLWVRGRFWDATALGFAVFYWGAAIGHVIELLVHGNDAPYNAGPILLTDVAAPLIILVLLVRMRMLTEDHPV